MARAKKDEIIARTIYPGKLDIFERKKDGGAVWAGRFPTSWLSKDAIEGVSSFSPTNQSPSPQFGTFPSSGLIDPYNNTTKRRFEDTFRADKIAQRAILKKVQFILSKNPTVRLEPNEEFAVKEQYQKALEKLGKKKELQDLVISIKKTDRRVKFHQHLIAAEIQKRVYGRSAMGILFKKGEPTDLRVFASKNLGRVHIDYKTWQFKGVEYHDNLISRKAFKAEELIYLTHLDYNITPNTIFYGLSELEGIAHDSETNRIISEEDLKELAKGHWAGIGIIKALGITSADKMGTLINGMDPGKWNATNADVTVEVHKIADKILEVAEVRERNDKRIIRGIDIPQPAMGYEDVTNRATMDTIMELYQATVMDFERLQLRSQLEPQWYDTLVMKELQIKDIEQAKARVVMDFEDLIFEKLSDRHDVIFGLLDRGLITEERVLKSFGLDDAVEDLAKLLEEKQQEEQEMMQDRNQMMQNPAQEKKPTVSSPKVE